MRVQQTNRHLIRAGQRIAARREAYAIAAANDEGTGTSVVPAGSGEGVQPLLPSTPPPMVVAPVTHPLGPPSLVGTLITVDIMLNQPTRVTRMIMDLTLQRFIADRIFASAGGVTGGAVVYDQATWNELYAARDVERVAPGAEFPLLTGVQLIPKVASVEKWGGKIFITDEARDRNNTILFMRLMRQVANTIVRKINARAIAEMNSAITTFNRTFVGHSWSAVVTAGTNASTAQNYPLADFAFADQVAEQDELGVMFNLVLMNPQEYAHMSTVYGATAFAQFLQFIGKSIYVSMRVPAGTAYFVQEGQVGEMRIEKPLGTETWREPETERTWSQSSVRPVMYVTNPYSVLQATGLT
jgi:hypothetical protein